CPLRIAPCPGWNEIASCLPACCPAPSGACRRWCSRIRDERPQRRLGKADAAARRGTAECDHAHGKRPSSATNGRWTDFPAPEASPRKIRDKRREEKESAVRHPNDRVRAR